MGIAKKHVSLTLILSLILTLAGTVNVSALKYVGGYFGWIGRECVLEEGDKWIELEFDSYADPEYWAGPMGGVLTFGVEGLENCLDFHEYAPKSVGGIDWISNKFENNEVTYGASDHTTKVVDPATGYFGKIILKVKVTNLNMLKSKIEASPHKRLNVSVKYGLTADTGGCSYEDASYVPKNWQDTHTYDYNAAINTIDLPKQRHTLFAPAYIVMEPQSRIENIERIAPAGNDITITLDKPLGTERLIVAVYGSGGRLCGIDTSPQQQAEPLNYDYIASFGAGVLDAVGTKVKVMIWENLYTMRPLYPAAEMLRTGMGADDWLWTMGSF